MKHLIATTLLTLVATSAVQAQEKNYPKALVSYEDFKNLVAQVETHRASRLIDMNTFLKMSKQPGTIILDTRSDFRFDRIHLKGAKHLSFTDFTQDNLIKLIPNPDTKILIYCNNNFDGNQRDFAPKQMEPLKAIKPMPSIATSRSDAVASQVTSQQKPIMLALNIPTYINLYGYGYRNVYELDELVEVKDPRVTFEGTIAKSSLTAQPVVAKVCPLHKEPIFLAALRNVDKNTHALSSLNPPKPRVWTSAYRMATPNERVQFALDYEDFLVSQGETDTSTDLAVKPLTPYDARMAFGMRWWKTSDKTSAKRPPVDTNFVHDALVDAGNSIQLTCETLQAMEDKRVKHGLETN